jgi:hypothetical protein
MDSNSTRNGSYFGLLTRFGGFMRSRRAKRLMRHSTQRHFISLVVRWMRLGDELSSTTRTGAPMAHARFLLHAFSLWPEKASETSASRCRCVDAADTLSDCGSSHSTLHRRKMTRSLSCTAHCLAAFSNNVTCAPALRRRRRGNHKTSDQRSGRRVPRSQYALRTSA